MASCVFERTTSCYEYSSGTNLSHHLDQHQLIKDKQIADNDIDLSSKFVEVIMNMRLMFEFLNMTYQTLAF